MVRYITMKRITQILASILFVITVLTVYLAFDFAISNAVSHKTNFHKHSHNHLHDETKITRKRSVTPAILHHTKRSNQTIKHHNENEDHKSHNDERRTRNIKQQQQQLRAKPGNFHKGKTGVKVNKPQKSIKEQKRRLSTSTMQSPHKDKHHLANKGHV